MEPGSGGVGSARTHSVQTAGPGVTCVVETCDACTTPPVIEFSAPRFGSLADRVSHTSTVRAPNGMPEKGQGWFASAFDAT